MARQENSRVSPIPQSDEAETRRRENRLAQAFKSLEPRLHEVHDMSEVASSIIEDALGQDHSRLGLPHDTYFLTKQQVRSMLFCCYHLQEMIKDLATDYFETLEA